MSTNTNTLATFREKAGMSLQDVAYVINVDQIHLQKVEDGDRPASVTIILIYHMLFRAPLEDMYAELYAHLHAKLLERSETLIANLKRKQSPKSTYRIESISKIVNSLSHDDYGCVN